MAGFRESFIKLSVAFSQHLSTLGLLRLTGQHTILPFYHAISDEPLPHIQHLYAVKNTRQFRKDLDQLLKVFKPIDLPEFQKLQEEKRKPAKPVFHLSFDDGLREFHDVIAPILQEKGVPATCFLNSGFVDNRDLFFRYKSSLLIDVIKNNRNLENAPEVKRWQKGLKENVSLQQNILSIKYSDRDKLDELAKEVGLDFKSFLRNNEPYLNTQQIEKLIGHGFHFGAHSVDHPEYRLIELPIQIEQTKKSIDWIKEQFNLNYKVFSFPFTDYKVTRAFFDEIAQQNIANITFGGAGQKQEDIPFHFQRMPLEIENLSARQIINSELLYYLLKAPLGKNRIQRQ